MYTGGKDNFSHTQLFSCGSRSTLADQWVPLPDLWMGKLRNRQGILHAQGCPVYQLGIAPISCCCSAASTRSYYECWFSWHLCKSIVELPPMLACKLQKKLGFSDPKICHENCLFPLLEPAMRLEKATGSFDDLLSPSSSTGEQKLQTFHPGCPRQFLFPFKETAGSSSCEFPSAWHPTRATFFGNLLFTFTSST